MMSTLSTVGKFIKYQLMKNFGTAFVRTWISNMVTRYITTNCSTFRYSVPRNVVTCSCQNRFKLESINREGK